MQEKYQEPEFFIASILVTMERYKSTDCPVTSLELYFQCVTQKQLKRSYSLYQPGMYAATVYDKNWFVGLVTARSDEYDDVEVSFMRQAQEHENNIFTWPRLEDKCWVPFQQILSALPTPSAVSSGARHYKLDKDCIETILKKFNIYANKHFGLA